jgi:hypothetical protein
MNLRPVAALGFLGFALLVGACGSVSSHPPIDGGTDTASPVDTKPPTDSADSATPQDTASGDVLADKAPTDSAIDTGTTPDAPPADKGLPGDDARDAAQDTGVATDATDATVVPDGGGDAGAGCPAAPAGIVSWWHGEDDYADAVGGSPGISLGGVTFAAGAIGRGFSFDGTGSSYIQVADAASLRITGPMTIDAWISPTSATATARIVDKITAGGANGYLLDLLAGQLRLEIGADSVSSGLTVPVGTFTHVTGVYSGTSLSLYFNGVLIATKTTTVTAVPVATLPLRIGADSAGATRFSGVIDEPRIFGRALSAAEVQDIYQSGSPAHCGCIAAPAGIISWWRGEGNFADARGTNTGTDSGGVTFSTGVVGQGFNLNGAANSYVLVPSSPSLQPTTALTIEAWIDPTIATTGRIVDKITPGATDGYLLDIVSSQLRFGIGADSVNSGATALLVAGRFTHVAGVYDGTTLNVYINGVRVANKATLLTTVAVNSLALHIGADLMGATRFSGLIDEVRIYSRALPAAEIAAIAAAGAAARCP